MNIIESIAIFYLNIFAAENKPSDINIGSHASKCSRGNSA